MRIVVTGGSGKAGRWVVRDLRERGHDVLNVDLVRDTGPHGTTLAVDLTDLGQCHDVIAGADAVVHLAAIPAPGLRPEGETFRNNILSTYNVFSAAAAHRVSRLVWASSETVLGLPFDTPPLFAPIDETIEPRPESSYALAKLLGEEMARQLHRRTGIPVVSLRISNIMEPEDYAAFPGFWADAQLRKWNLWSYVDVRDVAQSVRLGLEAAHRRCRGVHHRRRRQRHDAAECGAHGGGVPRRAPDPGGPGPRDAALHRTSPPGPGLRPAAHLAGARLGVESWTPIAGAVPGQARPTPWEPRPGPRRTGPRLRGPGGRR